MLGIGIACIVSIICCAIIIRATTPEAATAILKILFFLSLFVALWTLVTLAIVGIRNRIQKTEPDSLIIPSLAQAFFLALAAMIVILISHLW
jgi:spore maturation protein SpmA